jgi:photosystem II stability/assembly factor-like uncharacterized protein
MDLLSDHTGLHAADRAAAHLWRTRGRDVRTALGLAVAMLAAFGFAAAASASTGPPAAGLSRVSVAVEAHTARMSAVSKQRSGVSAELYGVSFSNGKAGWAVGTRGTVVRTTNGGVGWKRLRSGVSAATLTAVDSFGTGRVWAISDRGDMLRSTSGGASWSRGRWSGRYAARLYALDFVSGTRGWVAGMETRPILQNSCAMTIATSNGGGRWTSVGMPLDPESRLGMVCVSVDFVSARTGYSVIQNQDGESRVYRSDDGGATWTEALPTVSDTLNDVSFSDADRGWAAGWNSDGAVLFHTEDGGATWYSTQLLGVSSRLNAVQAVGTNTVWACGENGLLASSMDDGQTWMGGSVTGVGLNDISFVSARSGWAVGEHGTILRIKL